MFGAKSASIAAPGIQAVPSLGAETSSGPLASALWVHPIHPENFPIPRQLPGALPTENQITKQIVDAAYHIHTTLGPGLFESVYEAVMAHELQKRNLKFTRQQPIPVIYETTHLGIGFQADLIVEDKVIIEIKSVQSLTEVHKKQLQTYLRLTNKKVGLLINFNESLIKNGLSRIANGATNEPWP